MRDDAQKQEWRRSGTVVENAPNSKGSASRNGRASAHQTRKGTRSLDEVVTGMAFSSNGWCAATSGGLLVSKDRGATWTRKPVGQLVSAPVESVLASPDGRRVQVVSLRGLVYSNDGGASWTWHDLPLQSGGALSLYADPTEENTLIASARNGLYVSSDLGATWRQAGSGLPSTPVQSFAVSDGVFVAAMRTGGLFVSYDSGNTWSRVPGILADGLFAAVAAGNEKGVVLAASTTEALYSLDLGSLRSGSADSAASTPEQAHRAVEQPGN
jgi:photosystem II stability/assembly factor-like uncharacterized protein